MIQGLQPIHVERDVPRHCHAGRIAGIEIKGSFAGEIFRVDGLGR